MFEGFFLGFAGRAMGRIVSLEEGSLGRKVTLAGSHLVDARGLKFAEPHKGVWFAGDGVFVGGIGVEP
jgi:hypothetical protein